MVIKFLKITFTSSVPAWLPIYKLLNLLISLKKSLNKVEK